MRPTVLILSALTVAGASGFFIGAAAQSKTTNRHLDVLPLPAGAPPRPFSGAVLAGDTLYLSGTVGNDPKTGIPPAAFPDAVRQAIANQTAALKAANMTWTDVVKVNVYVKDMAKYAEFNAIYMKELPAPYPARTFIAVADLPANGQVEIEGIAVKRQ